MKTTVASTTRNDTRKRKLRSDRRVLETPEDLASIHLKRILVPVDFSVASTKALAYAVALARQFGAELILLHVVEPIPWSADYGYGEVHGISPNEYLLTRSRNRLEALRQRRTETGCKCRTVVRSGKAFNEIAKAAGELDAGLIILATHGHVGLDRALLGSTTERVVRHAPCPVLVVRPKEHEFVGEPSERKERS